MAFGGADLLPPAFSEGGGRWQLVSGSVGPFQAFPECLFRLGLDLPGERLVAGRCVLDSGRVGSGRQDDRVAVRLRRAGGERTEVDTVGE